MTERPNNGWQAWLAGALFLGLIAAALLINRRPAPSAPQPTATPVVRATTSEPAPLAVPEPPLDRARLVQIAALAADAFAAGSPAPQDQPALVGRAFELRIPFGCAGPLPANASASFGWRYDAKRETLRAFATPADWTGAAWLGGPTGIASEQAAEGFAIDRPWLLSGRCPRAVAAGGPSHEDPEPAVIAAPGKADAADTTGEQPPAPALGVVQFFGADEPRSGRGDRGYTAVVKRAREAIRPGMSFVLVLRGQLVAFPSGQPVACWGDAWRSAPHCLIAMRLERVALVDDEGTELARWDR